MVAHGHSVAPQCTQVARELLLGLPNPAATSSSPGTAQPGLSSTRREAHVQARRPHTLPLGFQATQLQYHGHLPSISKSTGGFGWSKIFFPETQHVFPSLSVTLVNAYGEISHFQHCRFKSIQKEYIYYITKPIKVNGRSAHITLTLNSHWLLEIETSTRHCTHTNSCGTEQRTLQHSDCDPLYFYTDYGWLALGLMAHYQHSPPGAR